MTQITETKTVDQITVTEHGTVLYREATRIMRGGEQIAQTFHRSSLQPGQDLTGVPANVVAICNAAWTPEVLAAYQAEQDRIAAEIAARQAADEEARLAAQVNQYPDGIIGTPTTN
jgi:DNA-binding transcriptional LysR family regulator